MKLIKAIAATACALALATAAQAETYTDSSENYDMGHGLATGDNAGSGFGAWVVDSYGSGDGWSGCGIWDPSANDFQGAWADKERAFGIIGKGSGFGITAYRPFRAALAVDDSFAIDMAVNWDPNIENAQKGFALTIGGKDVVVINHGNYPGKISINGDDSNEALNNSGTYPMTWTFTAKDATTLSYTVTPRDGADLVSGEIAVTSSAIDGFRLQSIGQNPHEDGAPEGEGQAWADRRQSYYDNFVLDVSGELMDFDTLTLAEDNETWAITSAEETALSFTLTRTSTDGEATVSISSSDSSFVSLSSETVTFEDGSATATFTGTAKLSAGGQVASISASGTGFNPLEKPWEVKGPSYDCNAWEDGNEEPWLIPLEDDIPLYVNNYQSSWFPGDDSKVTVVSEDESVITVAPAEEWQTSDGENPHTYASWTVSSVAPGQAKAEVLYDGVKVAEYGFTVPAPLVPGFELSGPQTVKPGQTYTYSLKATLTEEELGCTVSFDPADAATADPASFDLADPAEDGFYYQDIEVTFGDISGDVTITVASDNYSADISVTVTAPLDPSLFDDYVAYDEAALYGSFDPASAGAGEKGFEAWSVYQDEAENGGVYVGGYAPESLAGIIENSKVLGLYANGTWENNNYKVYRGFGGDLEPGQEFAIDFACEATGGSRVVQLVRMWEGTGYPRFEVYTSDGYVGVNLEGFEGGDIGWAPADRVLHLSVLRSADAATYTLSLTSGDDTWTKDIPASTENWGDGLQGVIIGAWNSGSDFFFNRMYIKQVEEPVTVRSIGWSEGVWNPEGDGTYEITLTATAEDIGEVAISVEPAEGNTGTLELASDTLDLDGATSATISYTLSGVVAGDSFKISAVPADTTVAALEGESAYGVSVIEPFLTLSCNDGWQFTTDTKEIWLSLSASPSKFGTYTLVSSDPSVLALSVESIDVPNAEGDSTVWFNVFVKGVGNSTISLAEDESVNWGFEISEGSQPEPIDIDAEVVTFVKGSMKFKLPEGGTIMTTTNLVTGPWVDFPAEVGEDGAVVIPTTGDGAFYRIGEPPATVVDDEGE